MVTFGVFDMLHLGHVALFKRCADYVGKPEVGEGKLIVAIQSNDFILKYKPDSKIVYSLEEKIFMLEAIRYIDEIRIYRNVDEDIKDIDFDILAVGPDQNHAGFQRAMQWCREHGKEVVVMPRTEGISSSLLKKQYKQDEKPSKDITLAELKIIQMDVLSAIAEFCCQHDIPYSMACGTLLGAVRHKGYIPWDDDIDIYIPREGYKKLVAQFPNKYKERYKLTSLERDPLWELPYAKAYDDTTILEENANHKENIGINIDIFPIDDVPSGQEWERYNKHRRMEQFLFALKSVRLSSNRSLAKNVILVLVRFFTFFYSKRRWAMRLDHLAQKYNGRGMEYCFECCLGMLQKQPFPKALFKELIDLPFEDRSFKAFSDFDSYLRNGFGDYMKLPPKEKRQSHHSFKAFRK